MKFLLILLFAFPAFTQDLPTFGQLSEIKGKSSYYVVTNDSQVRRTVEKELGTLLKPVGDPVEAQLFVEYKIIARENGRTILGDLEKGELRLYYYRDKTQVVVWSESAWGSLTHRKLAKKLRSALKKAS